MLSMLAFAVVSCLGTSDKKEESNTEDSETVANVDPSDFRKESALGLYEISVPDYMKSTTGLNADASMQFQNIFKETYLAIIEEPKQDFIDTFEELGEYDSSKSPAMNYQEIQMSYFTEGMSVNKLTDPKNMKLNGLDAEQVELSGRVPGIDFDIFYLMTFAEGEDTLYMIMEWTLKSREDDYKETFEYMATTFREL